MDKIETALNVGGLFTERINRFLGSVVDEIKQNLDNGLQAYTNTMYAKINKVKTFIYRENSVDFYSIYFPLILKNGKDKYVKVPLNVEKLFSSCNYLTILGRAGSGKTMLMRHCFLSVLKTSSRIPIIIELRELNHFEGSLYEYISQFVFHMKLAVNEQIMNRLMDSGEFVFFFDGYDELNLVDKQERTSQICNFVDRFPNNYYLLTSRPDADAESLSRFNNYHVCPLSTKQVQDFIFQQTKLIPEGGVLAEKMIDAISTADNNISAYFSNPLLLSMFILTFGYHPTIPSRKTDFYFNVFDTLYTKHDSVTKGGGYVHDTACRLERYQYVKILQWFCYRTYFKQQYVFSRSLLQTELTGIRDKLGYDYDNDKMIYDLTVAISVLVQDGLSYVFPHRSMQEYFAAQLIAELPDQVRITKIYENPQFASSQNQNLWSLCQELDEYVFKKHFVVVHLKKFVEQINCNINTEESEISLLKYIIDRASIQFDYNRNGFIGTISHRGINEPISILSLYSRNNMDLLETIIRWMFGNMSKIFRALKEKYGSELTDKNHTNFKTEESLLFPLLIEDKIHMRVFEQFKSIIEITKNIDNLLNNWDSNNIQLLNL